MRERDISSFPQASVAAPEVLVIPANPEIPSDPRLDAALKTLDAGIERALTAEGFADYLHMQSRFHSYSANNVMLIMAQRPDASKVAGYRKWQELGRLVRKGEKAIKIFVPHTYRDKDDLDDRRGLQEGRVAGTLGGRSRVVVARDRAGGEVKDLAQLDTREETLAQKMPEPLRRIVRQVEIFVHVKCGHSRPGDPRRRAERGEHLALRGCGAEDRLGARLPGEPLQDRRGDDHPRRRAHRRTVGVDPHPQPIDLRAR